MKRRAAVAVILAICFLFGGCSLWMSGDYLSVTPHVEQSQQQGTDIVDVSNFAQMRDALLDLVHAGTESGIVSTSSYKNASLHFYVDSAIRYVTQNDPVGAYAVDKITYEIGTNRGDAVIAFKIQYLHNRSELLRIRRTQTMQEVTEVIHNAMENLETSVVLRVSQYSAVDFTQLVEDHANNRPDVIMQTPQVTASVYPDKGDDRLIAISFTYQTSRDELKRMQEQVAPVFTSAELYVKETSQVWEIYSRLYSFLIERDNYTIETSVTPTYSLLHHGVGDSRAFANIYARMCRRAELDCRVVSGTRDGIPWCWNIVRYRGAYYHVDLLSDSETDEFQMLRASEMDNYVWDYEIYPME